MSRLILGIVGFWKAWMLGSVVRGDLLGVGDDLRISSEFLGPYGGLGVRLLEWEMNIF